MTDRRSRLPLLLVLAATTVYWIVPCGGVPRSAGLFGITSHLSGGHQQEPPVGGEDDDGDDDEDRPRAPSPHSSSSRRRRPPPPRRRDQLSTDKKPSPLLARLARGSLSLTGKAAMLTAKTSGKAAYHLMRPKHVDVSEIFGLWRFDQQIVFSSGRGGDVDDEVLEATANIEFRPEGTVVVRASTDDDDDGSGEGATGEREGSKGDTRKLFVTRFKFTPATPIKCARIEFDARAFLVEAGYEENDHDKRRLPPALYFYKGYVGRKLADSSVIKIKGKIYRIEKTGWRGQSYKHVAIGTFVARRRLRLASSEDETDDDDDDGWEGEDDEEHGAYVWERERGRQEDGGLIDDEGLEDEYDEE